MKEAGRMERAKLRAKGSDVVEDLYPTMTSSGVWTFVPEDVWRWKHPGKELKPMTSAGMAELEDYNNKYTDRMKKEADLTRTAIEDPGEKLIRSRISELAKVKKADNNNPVWDVHLTPLRAKLAEMYAREGIAPEAALQAISELEGGYFGPSTEQTMLTEAVKRGYEKAQVPKLTQDMGETSIIAEAMEDLINSPAAAMMTPNQLTESVKRAVAERYPDIDEQLIDSMARGLVDKAKNKATYSTPRPQ
jgi:hypothetical protein